MPHRSTGLESSRRRLAARTLMSAPPGGEAASGVSGFRIQFQDSVSGFKWIQVEFEASVPDVVEGLALLAEPVPHETMPESCCSRCLRFLPMPPPLFHAPRRRKGELRSSVQLNRTEWNAAQIHVIGIKCKSWNPFLLLWILQCLRFLCCRLLIACLLDNETTPPGSQSSAKNQSSRAKSHSVKRACGWARNSFPVGYIRRV